MARINFASNRQIHLILPKALAKFSGHSWYFTAQPDQITDPASFCSGLILNLFDLLADAL